MTDAVEYENIDVELYNKFRSGSKSAYQTLFEKYYSQLVKFSFLYVKDADISEEIVQDFFVKLWIKRESVEIKSAVKSYLYSAVRNRSFNYLRDKKDYLEIDLDLPLIDKITSRNDDKNFDLEFIQNKIQSAIESLPDKCRTIFRMSREEQLTYKQIAEKLDISRKTVENQMGIALKKLRETLQPVLNQFITILLYVIIKNYFHMF